MQVFQRCKALRVTLVVTTAMACAWARAHGEFPPKFGGWMSRGGEISFELVSECTRLVVYMEDHGTPIPSAAAGGHVRTSIGQPVHVARLVPAGANRFIVDGMSASPGERLVLVVAFPDGTGGGAFVDIPFGPHPVCATARKP